jgi:hypothetical protein
MTVMRVTTLRAAETLAEFHRHRAENTAGEARAYHEDMARWYVGETERIKRKVGASGVTVENQVAAMRRRDLATAQKIIDRHPIMHGVGMPVEEVAQARVAMVSDIADALAAERGGLTVA